MNPLLHFAYFRKKRQLEAAIHWPTEQLDLAKNTGDELADQVISDIIHSGSIHQINELLDSLSNTLPSGDIELPSGMPPSVNTYLDFFEKLPKWADPHKITRAQKFFTTHGANFGVALMFKSLPVLYLGKQGGVQVLNMTGQLKDHFQRRAAETLKFVLDVMSQGGLKIQESGDSVEMGTGLRTIQKVRLMHAAVRHYARYSGQWPQDGSWGVPINQEELAGTMLAFSSVALDGLTQLGLKPDSQEEEDYLHVWRVIGHFLGIHHQNMPQDLKSAGFLWMRMDERNFGPTPSGVKLTNSHVAFLEQLIPGRVLDNIVPSLMTYLLGWRYAHWLEVGKVGWTSIFISLIKWVFSITEKFTHLNYGTQAFMQHENIELMKNLEKLWAKGVEDSPPFRIPAPSDMDAIPGRPKPTQSEIHQAELQHPEVHEEKALEA